MQYTTVQDLIDRDGLRIVLVQGVPSPWGQAAKAMMEHKGLAYAAAPLLAGDTNDDVVAWSGVNSGPVVAWNDEAPINRWNDILFLLERLAPQKSLVPEDPAERVQVIGLSHEICGELGLGWNRRLSLFKPMMESGQPPEGVTRMGKKYRYNESDVAAAVERQVATLNMLAAELEAQDKKGSAYFVGDRLTAVDFYWAAFCNIFDILPLEKCPTAEGFRPMFELIEPAVKAALDPGLLAHRDRVMEAHFKLPMEF
jgi:glutathione S-transferase